MTALCRCGCHRPAIPGRLYASDQCMMRWNNQKRNRHIYKDHKPAYMPTQRAVEVLWPGCTLWDGVTKGEYEATRNEYPRGTLIKMGEEVITI